MSARLDGGHVSNERLKGLDSLRGIAASFVLIAHTLAQMPKDGGVLEAVDLGTLGVVLFFLISGFVIPFSLKRGLVAFGISRGARLLPALWVSIAFCLALGEPLQGTGQLLANAFMVAPVFGEPRISGPYWTLTWELGFYAIVALLFAPGWSRSPRAIGLLAIATAVGAMISPWALYFTFMFVGTLLRMTILEKDETARAWFYAAVITLAGYIALLVWLSDPPGDFLIALLLPLPLFLLLWNRLTHPSLLWLGAISYSLYLFNLPIVEAVKELGLPAIVFAPVCGVLSLFMAAVVYRWVERPMIERGKGLARREWKARDRVACSR